MGKVSMSDSVRKRFCRFVSPFWAYPGVFVRSFTKETFFALVPLVHIYFIEKIIAVLEVGNENGFISIISRYAGILIASELFNFLIRKRGRVETVNTYRRKIHDDAIRKFVVLDNTYTTGLGTGKVLSILNKGMDVWALELNNFTKNAVTIVITFLYALVVIYSSSSLYALIFLLLYILVHVYGVYINASVLKYRRERYVAWNQYVARLVRIIMSKYEILQSGETEKEIIGLNTIADGMDDANDKMATPIYAFYAVPEGFISFSQLLIIFLLGYQVLEGTLGIASLVGIFGIFTLLRSAITNSITYFKDFTNSLVTIEGMRKFFDETPILQSYTVGEDFIYKQGHIEIENLTFGYTDSLIFNDFDVQLQGNKKTAFVGPSGGGKSTLIKLIAGYLDMNSGTISIDGQTTADISKKSLYRHIGYLTQEPNVFDGTIKENITYGLGSEDEEKLYHAIVSARCEFIYEFTDGLDTLIGERGIRLSGGQRQRLALAKVFMKDPDIIILDEPTSALDSESEEAVTQVMNTLFRDRTVIIIAHRLQTVKHADDIIFLEDGKVMERGTHEALMNLKGKYFKMVELQSGF